RAVKRAQCELAVREREAGGVKAAKAGGQAAIPWQNAPSIAPGDGDVEIGRKLAHLTVADRASDVNGAAQFDTAAALATGADGDSEVFRGDAGVVGAPVRERQRAVSFERRFAGPSDRVE